MNRIALFLSVLLLAGLISGTSAVAQENEEPEMYARSFYIRRVYPNRLGYRIIYTNDTGQNQELYVPLRWFRRDDGIQTAEIRHGRNESYPYMEVFWRDGEFSHMKIFVRQDYSHDSWGSWDAPSDVEDLFDIDEPEFNL
ncbi:MAG: hypothetical protein ACLFM0_03555 [Spirochaetales bacterium]